MSWVKLTEIIHVLVCVLRSVDCSFLDRLCSMIQQEVQQTAVVVSAGYEGSRFHLIINIFGGQLQKGYI